MIDDAHANRNGTKPTHCLTMTNLSSSNVASKDDPPEHRLSVTTSSEKDRRPEHCLTMSRSGVDSNRWNPEHRLSVEEESSTSRVRRQPGRLNSETSNALDYQKTMRALFPRGSVEAASIELSEISKDTSVGAELSDDSADENDRHLMDLVSPERGTAFSRPPAAPPTRPDDTRHSPVAEATSPDDGPPPLPWELGESKQRRRVRTQRSKIV